MHEADQIRLWRLNNKKGENGDEDFERIFHDSGLEFVRNEQNNLD